MSTNGMYSFVNCFIDFIIGNVQFTQSSDILSEVQ